MSAAKMGKKWADVDEDEEDDVTQGVGMGKTGNSFETAPDKDGIKTVIEYTERGGQTYKVTKRVKVTKVKTWTNASIAARKSMKKFGLALTNDPKNEAMLIVREQENVPIEVAKKAAVTLATKDDAEERFFEESIAITEGLFKEKKAWTATRTGMGEGEQVGVAPATAEPAAGASAPSPAAAEPAAGANAPSRYVPPSLRGVAGKGGGKDAASQQQQQEASLRITNLSEDVKEGDLQDLFGQCGRLQRVYLAKDMTTFQSKGFAFITYYNREDAQKAINKLNGHGYDNLILQVQWAKPKV
jgi:translation initiation factor 3 subunit G